MNRSGRFATLLCALVGAAAGIGLAQEPPPGYRVRIGTGDAPRVDPLAPAPSDAGVPDAEPETADLGPLPAEAGTLPPEPASAAPAPRARRAKAKPRRTRKARRAKRARWDRTPAVTPLEAAQALGEATGSVIEFAQPIEFRHDSTAVAESARPALAEVVDYLQASPEIRLVLIEGHTDATGTLRYNQALSEARAVSVRKALIAAGVSPDRLMAYGYGETRPATAEQAPNRRVVFRMIEGDREALTARVATDWGQAALVHSRGVVEAAASPESDAETTPSEATAVAGAGDGPDDEGDEAPASAVAPAPPRAMTLVIAPPSADGRPAARSSSQSIQAPAADSGRLPWQPIAVRTQIAEGRDIRTGPGSHALLRLPDLGRIWLGPHTRVRLSKLHHDRDDGKTYLALRVRRGTVRAMLNPLQRNISRSLIALPGSGLQVVAADFELAVDDAGIGRIRVDRGRVELTDDRQSRSVFAGQGTRLGIPGAEPRGQLPPPTAKSPLEGRFARPPALVWQPVPGAGGYRVEVAADVDFDQPLIRARTTAPRFEPRVLTPDTPWYWRVRAIDGDGATGSPSRIHQFRTAPIVETRPAAAQLRSPDSGNGR